jgi:hypothetical protein
VLSGGLKLSSPPLPISVKNESPKRTSPIRHVRATRAGCAGHPGLFVLDSLPRPLGLCPLHLVVCNCFLLSVSFLVLITHAYTTLHLCRPGSGFKLAFSASPQNLTFNIGATVSAPPITVSTRFGDIGEWVTLNLTAGANAVPLTSIGLVDPARARFPLVLDVVTQFEGGNARLELESIELDSVRACSCLSRNEVWNIDVALGSRQRS